MLVKEPKCWLAEFIDAVEQATQPGMRSKKVKAVHFAGFGCKADSDRYLVASRED
jgi:hypothetical protein